MALLIQHFAGDAGRFRAYVRENPFAQKAMISTGLHALIIFVLLVWSFISFGSRAARDLCPFDLMPLGSPGKSGGGGGSSVAAPAPPREVVKPNDGWTAVKPPRNPGRTNQIKNDPKPPATQPGIKPLSKEALEKIFGDAMSKVGGPGTAPFGTYGTGPGGGKYDPLNWYYSMVKAAMYEAWQQPSALAGTKGLLTRALIRVQRDGKIIQRSLDLSSGNALMDSSVMTAVESVAQLEALPPGFGGDYKDITIDFRLTETPLAE